jgi:hypothetical protein
MKKKLDELEDTAAPPSPYSPEQALTMQRYGSHAGGKALPLDRPAQTVQGTDVRGFVPQPSSDIIYAEPRDSVPTPAAMDHSKQINWQRGQIGEAGAAVPTAAQADTSLPPGSRYKRVANSYENAAPGLGATSMIATRGGEIVDLSGKSDIGTPGKSSAQPTGAVPGFTNQDLVDLYGGPAKSAMTDEQWKAQIDQNSAMPAGWTWDQATGKPVPMNPSVKNTWQQQTLGGPQNLFTREGTDAELSFNTPGHTSMPAIDLSGPGAMVQSALPYAVQNAADRRKAYQIQQQHQLFKDKYGIDLKRIELGIQAQTAASNAAKNQAEIGKMHAETSALPAKGNALGGKLSIEQTKQLAEMYQMNPEAFDAIAGIHDQPEETRAQLRPQKLREMLGYGGVKEAGAAPTAPASGGTPGAKKPTYAEFVSAVRAKGSRMPDDQLQAYYSQNYGG